MSVLNKKLTHLNIFEIKSTKYIGKQIFKFIVYETKSIDICCSNLFNLSKLILPYQYEHNLVTNHIRE